MNDYERIARIIRRLDETHTEQPDLAELASVAGLSTTHFHRLFTAWAGITPKDFLQCLTLEHARSLLRAGSSVLDAAVESGLSGPGRLHDLCVTLEAASPGEMKAGGAGWTIVAGVAETPFGAAVIGESPRGICHLSFFDEADSLFGSLRADWPHASVTRNDATAAQLAARIFSPTPQPGARPLRALVRGTAFQVSVWRALLRIPRGSVVTYGRLAAVIGQPAAARAVGTAVGSNAISYLIPCHRVIRETGVIGGYRWSPTRKRAMLAWESAAGRTAR